MIRMTSRALAAPSRLILGPASYAPALIHNAAYANTLTAILPSLYSAMNVVSRELVGFVPAVMRAPSVERAAVGQAVPYPIAPAQTATDVVPAMQVPTPPDNTFSTGTMSITKSRKVAFGFTGEEQRSLNVGGVNSPSYLDAQGMIFAEALRTLTNEVEADLSAEAAANASRGYGTQGTTPFGNEKLTDLAQIQKILNDNGAPLSGRAMILNTSAGANFRTIQNLTRVNEAGTQMTLRDGELGQVYGMSIHETGQAVNKTKGTGASATTNAAGYAIGATVITLASAGTGTITQGDFVTFAGDTNKYNVVSGDADVSNGGTITLAAPGLRVAIPASATAITLGNSYSANVAFSQDAMALAARLPALPNDGDLALDRKTIIDIRSGLAFEVAIYPGYRMIEAEVALAWGVKAIKRNHIAMLFG